MKKFVRIGGVVLIAALAVYTMYYLYQKDKKNPEQYATEKPFTTDIIKKTVATGSIIPEEEVQIKPQISGIISELYVEEGDMVKQGDLIAKIKVIPDMVSLNNAEARVEAAEIRKINAEREYKRNKDLFEKRVLPENEYRRFENDYLNAMQEQQAAMSNLEIVKEGAARKSTGASNTLVRATVTGMVLEVPIKVGNQVIQSNNFNDGTTIASVADMNQLIFEGQVDESEVGKLREGMDLILTIGALEDVTFNAKLNHIAPKGVEENGAIQFKIKADVALSDDHFIRAAYSANASIVLDRADSVLAIKESLLQFDKEKNPYVEIAVGEQSFERKDVELGISDGINVQVLSGIGGDDDIKVYNKPL